MLSPKLYIELAHAIIKAATSIPDGYRITCSIERGAIKVGLVNPQSIRMAFGYEQARVIEQIEGALEFAIDDAKLGKAVRA